MELTAKQAADYHKLRAYYPYRMFFLVQPAGEPEAEIWAMRDLKAVNRVIREGGTVNQIEIAA